MQKWEYLFVTTSVEGSAARPWKVNGQELPDWKKGPPMHEFANQLGDQGWELAFVENVGAWMVFKRPKP